MELSVEQHKPDCPHACALIRPFESENGKEMYVCHKGTLLHPETEIEVFVRV